MDWKRCQHTCRRRLTAIWKSGLSVKIKWKFFQSVAGTIVSLHHFDPNEIPGEKVRLDLQKDAARCFKQILDTTPCKTTAVWLLSSHLTNHASKMRKTCWALLVKLGGTHKPCSLMGSYTSADQCWPTSKNLHSSALCRLERTYQVRF